MLKTLALLFLLTSCVGELDNPQEGCYFFTYPDHKQHCKHIHLIK